MLNLVVLASIIPIILSSDNATPLVPGDNSHYVEGESRYIWMPNSEGVPHLIDLLEQPDEEILTRKRDNQYWLYTRSNPDTPQIITYDNKDSLLKSNYNKKKQLIVIVHGWVDNGNGRINKLIKDAFFEVLDVNVIVVDWKKIANSNYITATRKVPSVGENLGNFLLWLIATAGGNWNNVHLVGFSLGAHIVGIAGRLAGGRPARITGLDAASPLWGNNPLALNISAGQYVESIHTDGSLLGMSHAIAHADFFPNRGKHPQPGCWFNGCSHNRSFLLFASSVRYNHFVSRKCNNLKEAQRNRCNGSEYNMGNGIITKRGSGIYGLTTKKKYPY